MKLFNTHITSLISFLFLFPYALFATTEEDVEDYDFSHDTIIPQSSLYPYFSYEFKYNPGRVLALDEYVKKWLKAKNTHSLALEIHSRAPLTTLFHVNHQVLDTKLNPYDAAYNSPELSAGIRLNLNHGTRMHRENDPAWGQLQPVDYESKLGNVLTVYGTFLRPIFSNRPIGTLRQRPTWSVAYYLGVGIGYFTHIYNQRNDIDNEFIGSHLNIYFTAGLALTFRINKTYDLRTGIDFSHHSNGALARPNKGANYLGPFLSLIYYPPEILNEKNERHNDKEHAKTITPYTSHTFLDFVVGIGGKTLLEDWQQTQFNTAPDAPNYRTSHFRLYPAYSFQTSILHRYALRWASGIGVDLFYGSYASHIHELDNTASHHLPHSPWSVGLAARHQAFYGNLTVRLAFGYYLYRHMGYSAKSIEKPYYERIGLHYIIPRLRNLSVGFSVNAHATKADFTELQIAFPFPL